MNADVKVGKAIGRKREKTETRAGEKAEPASFTPAVHLVDTSCARVSWCCIVAVASCAREGR